MHDHQVACSSSSPHNTARVCKQPTRFMRSVRDRRNGVGIIEFAERRQAQHERERVFKELHLARCQPPAKRATSGDRHSVEIGDVRVTDLNLGQSCGRSEFDVGRRRALVVIAIAGCVPIRGNTTSQTSPRKGGGDGSCSISASTSEIRARTRLEVKDCTLLAPTRWESDGSRSSYARDRLPRDSEHERESTPAPPTRCRHVSAGLPRRRA